MTINTKAYHKEPLINEICAKESVCQINPTTIQKKQNNIIQYYQPKTCFDYFSFQRNLKINTGDTKIYYQQRIGECYHAYSSEYALRQPLQKCRSFDGVPQLSFIDRILNRKEEKMLKYCNEVLKECCKQTRYNHKHQKMVGPAWFQKLSCSQSATSKKNSIIDGLLLSAVVHLTIQETLKELQRLPKASNKITNLKNKRNYAPPHYFPSTSVRVPKRFSEINCTKHGHRSQSPYFCYLKDLRKMQQQLNEFDSLNLTSTHNLINKEKDQYTKEKLMALVNPTKLFQKLQHFCYTKDFRKIEQQLNEFDSLNLTSTHNLINNGRDRHTKNKLMALVNPTKLLQKLQHFCYTKTSKLSDGECLCPSKTTCSCSLEVTSCADESVQCKSTTKSVNCLEIYLNQQECFRNEINYCLQEEIKFLDSSTINTDDSTRLQYESVKSENVSTKCETKSRKSAERTTSFDCHCWYKNFDTENKRAYGCNCDFDENSFCLCGKNQKQQKKKAIYRIHGMKETEEGIIPIIDGVTQVKSCNCLNNYYQAKIKQFENEKKKEAEVRCGCVKKAHKLFQTSFCECEKPKEDRRPKQPRYIIGGVKETVSNGKVPIINGISKEQSCCCLKEYEKKINAFREFQKRKKLVYSLKEQQDKFIIGGVVNIFEDPVYVITGVCPPTDFASLQNVPSKQEVKHIKTIMPKVPAAGVQYNISGVRETSTGNVYILENALPIQKCDCLTVQKK